MTPPDVKEGLVSPSPATVAAPSWEKQPSLPRRDTSSAPLVWLQDSLVFLCKLKVSFRVASPCPCSSVLSALHWIKTTSPFPIPGSSLAYRNTDFLNFLQLSRLLIRWHSTFGANQHVELL